MVEVATEGSSGSAGLMLHAALKELQRGVTDGLHYGAQLSVVFRGRRSDLIVGEAGPGQPMTSEATLCWSSSVKPLASLALAQLQEKGLLRFSDPVSMHLPGFAACGKSGITLANCLTHTAGLWGSARGAGPGAPAEKVLQHICKQPLPPDWEPGKRCGYDSPAWYVLAGVVSAVDPLHRPYEKYLEEEIFAPLGLSSCSLGLSKSRRFELEASDRLASIYQARCLGGKPWRPVPEESRPEQEYPCPAGNGRGPASELASIYASLLPGAKQRLLTEEAVNELTQVARQGIVDELQGVDISWSLGFALSCILSGRHASPQAFGHGGSQSSWAYADPEHDLAVACLCNGKPGPELHYRRVGAISTAVYEDLGLASTSGSLRTFELPCGMGTF
ncbi:unnamed protein product [Polarella glacialis]|uniref:Beta-lactamase-related domain-containing protein n=1 Tax=Polarella glacialis TaxID=89957 RepID=A0A813LF07_POLGL|nr:unnamed protein product [Polarella glacialis]